MWDLVKQKDLKRLEHIEGEDGQACAFFTCAFLVWSWSVLDGTRWDQMGPRSTLRYSEVPQSTQRYLKVPKCTVATWVPIWGIRSPWGPYSVFGSPFLFQGPHCLYLMLKNAWKVHALPLSIVDDKITCDNTHESHANLSKKSVLFNVFPPFKGFTFNELACLDQFC